jgi:hypothetical protein
LILQREIGLVNVVHPKCAVNVAQHMHAVNAAHHL